MLARDAKLESLAPIVDLDGGLNVVDEGAEQSEEAEVYDWQIAPRPEAEPEPVPANQVKSHQRAQQFRNVSNFKRGKERRQERIEQARELGISLQELEREERVQTDHTEARLQQRAFSDMEVARREKREAAAAQRVPKLLSLAFKSGFATEEEVAYSRQSIEDGYTSAVECEQMWEDQLTRAGVLDNSAEAVKARKERQAARALVGSRVRVMEDFGEGLGKLALEEAIRTEIKSKSNDSMTRVIKGGIIWDERCKKEPLSPTDSFQCCALDVLAVWLGILVLCTDTEYTCADVADVADVGMGPLNE